MKRKLTCTNYIIILEKRVSREHTTNPDTNVRARPDFTFSAVGYHPPHTESQLAIHIYYVKGLVGEGNNVLKIFFYFLYV